MTNNKRIIAAVSAAIITLTSTSIMPAFADSDYGFASTSTAAETPDEQEIADNRLYDKLGHLLKLGDMLKYGEALYTTGTPDGEKWSQELYEQKVAIIGEDIIAKYIVDGEFLRDKVEADMEAITAKYNKYSSEITLDINNYLSANGISGYACIREIDGEEKICVTYDGQEEKIKAYIAEKGIDESAVVYRMGHDDVVTKPAVITIGSTEATAVTSVEAIVDITEVTAVTSAEATDDVIEVTAVTIAEEPEISTEETVPEKVELPEEQTPILVIGAEVPSAETIKGDANCDNDVDMADAVLIMQSIANPGKFGVNGTDKNRITEQGSKNADITGNNDGVTNADALAVQKKLLGQD